MIIVVAVTIPLFRIPVFIFLPMKHLFLSGVQNFDLVANTAAMILTRAFWES